MKIYSWNVNGIRAARKKGFLEWVKKESPDVLCLQETKASVEQLDDELVNIPGYHSFFHSAERKGYSGVATYTKIKPLEVNYKIGIDRFDNEGRIIVSEYDRFILFNIYFPNGQKDDQRLRYKLDFYDELLKYWNNLRDNGKNLVICGDYNTAHNEIDLKNPKANSERSGFLPIEREWMDHFIANGYVDTFRKLNPETVKYSWWSYRTKSREKNTGWRIDYHFVNESFFDHVRNAEILNDVMGSDHCPVVLDLDI